MILQGDGDHKRILAKVYQQESDKDSHETKGINEEEMFAGPYCTFISWLSFSELKSRISSLKVLLQ